MPEAVQTSKILQPHPLTPAMQMVITFLSLCVATGAIIYAIRSAADERNARLVEIGIGVLRVDPTKNPQVSGARKWALDLIDANSGGVKFSPDAREALIEGKLYIEPIDGGYVDTMGPGPSPSVGTGQLPPQKPPQSN